MKVSTDNIVYERPLSNALNATSVRARTGEGVSGRATTRRVQKIFSVDSALQLTTLLIKGIELIISGPAESRLNVEPECRKD